MINVSGVVVSSNKTTITHISPRRDSALQWWSRQIEITDKRQ